jgi:Zn-dependent peptidase ImmA (M78 family)
MMTEAVEQLDEMDWVARYKRLPPVQVFDLIKKLGVEFRLEDMPRGQSGKIFIEDGHYVIAVNENDSKQRRRFSAAHELGHYLLHRDLLGERGHLDRLYDEYANRNPHDPFSFQHEVQANSFAAEILMPENTIKRIRREHPLTEGRLRELANKFDVSPAAMKIRLESLGETIRPSEQ